MAGPLADFVISLNTDGHIISQGSISEALAKDSKLAEEIKHEEEAVELDENEDTAAEAKPADEKKGKLVVAEEIAVGHVSWSACELARFATSAGVVLTDSLSLFSQTLSAGLGRTMAYPVLAAIHRRKFWLGILRRHGDVVARLLGSPICSEKPARR